MPLVGRVLEFVSELATTLGVVSLMGVVSS